MHFKSFFVFILLITGANAIARANPLCSDSIKTSTVPSPSFLTKKYFHKDSLSLFQRKAIIADPFLMTTHSATTSAIDNGLSKSGSIARSISVGNAQDLGVLSSFNLQLAGKLNNDIDLLAVISDDNIPVQPEGNTQQLQEFDRVFIQVNNTNSKLIAGDFELKSRGSYFLNYLKKGKGVLLSTHQNNYDITIGTAIAKGKYSKYEFLGTEGSQGPYKIKGPNNESYLVVMAGTERVYIDGELLKRGENQDYTIDYNSAEIIFTNRKMITAYSRIIIEFEYSERSYSRTVNVANANFKLKKIDFSVNYYNEKDNKNINFLQNLSSDQKLFLSNIGDQLDKAFYSSADSTDLNPNQILYQKKDSLGYLIYVYNPTYAGQHFKLTFTDVGPNAGNYILSNSSANGRVYEWVQPISGIPQGNFEPIVKLITPKQQEQMSIGFSYSPKKDWFVSNEFAFSNRDLNLYSTIGDKDNIGFANKTIIRNQLNLSPDTSNSLKLINSIAIELVDKHFNAVENYRPIQFARVYSLIPAIKTNEIWLTYNSKLLKNEHNYLEYKANFLNQQNQYNAIQHVVLGSFLNKDWKLNNNTALMLSRSKFDLSSTNYFNQKSNIERNFKFINIGLTQELEKNQSNFNLNDSLKQNSFAFSDIGIYIKNSSSINKAIQLAYNHRLDKNPYLNDLATSTNANSFSFNADFNRNKNSIWSVNYLYRKLDVMRSNVNLKNDENNIARIKHEGNFFMGMLSSTTFYEIGSGQEPKKAFTFVEVPLGQGLYIYKDYNGNGVKELNEFELAKFSYEANYLKVSLLSTEFVRTKSTSITENILIDPAKYFSANNIFSKVGRFFSNQLTLKIDKKIADAGNFNINPFAINKNDTNLVSYSNAIRNTLYVNRANPAFGLDYTIQLVENKNLLVNGYDNKNKTEQIWQIRTIFLENYLCNGFIKYGSKGYQSLSFKEKNYNIDYIEFKPELTCQINYFWRITSAASYATQQNNSILKEQSRRISFNMETSYNAAGSFSLTSKCSFIKNRYNASANNAIAYEMLDGLQIGNNYTWNFVFQRNFGSGIQLSIIYDGRASAAAPTINIGSVQARAFF
jgi:hypothetical protein